MLKVIVSAFIILGSLSYSQNATQSMKIDGYGCQFYYNPPQANITFLYCTTTSNNHQTAWQQCLDSCCPDIKSGTYPAPNYNALVQCKKSIKFPSPSIIYLIILYGIGVVCIIIFTCFAIILLKFIKNSCHSKSQSGQNIQIEWKQLAKNMSTNIQQLNWIQGTQIKQKSNQLICTICLQNKCFTELYCQHLYHAQCIGQWLRKSNFCPLCHLQNLRLTKNYCPNCLKDFFLCDINFIHSHSLDLTNLRCKRCKESKSESIELYPVDSMLIFDISNQSLDKND